MRTNAATAEDLRSTPARTRARRGARPLARIQPRRTPSRPPAAVPASPFLKWAGGKGRLLPPLLPLLPPAVERRLHIEPFMGGAALFFHRRPKRAVLADLNRDLVETYLAVRDEPEALIEALRPLAAEHDQARYYERRQRYNEGRGLRRVERAALFVYLNKTCFNGLHRVNRKGEFNVPFGRYKNPRVLDAEGIRRASAALQGVDIRCEGFEQVLRYARPGDFVYFDPPYLPVSETANFTSYAREGFGPAEHERLRDVFAELDRRGCKVMLSNSDAPLVRALYRGYRIERVAAARAISCNGRGRGAVTELVVLNY